VTLGVAMSALLMRVMRAAMIDVLQQDYVAFARAKGLSPRRVLLAHAFKNAMIPVVTVAALETGYLLGGNTIVETVFGWPGLARVIVEAVYSRDYPLVQAGVLVIAVIYVMVNFAADVIYMLLNPRVKL
jgi:peptide/nickel transport system permease protein